MTTVLTTRASGSTRTHSNSSAALSITGFALEHAKEERGTDDEPMAPSHP